ncbi:PadR family transcriptional regulator [Actinotalea subterranea]|uniref:PadR family transcriptional regulator n=1 Tax=Actinotalea subterranea TaxID=2607497 RepID=UPI0011EC5636|nr:PadR family transcriptional regulator [Actinotalea subterranea]
MSVRHALLALLGTAPVGAFALRQEFERRTGRTWPLNMGQVSTTLDRLERDGLVAEVPSDGDVPHYALTDGGRAELESWWAAPVERGVPARDELAMKLALAVTLPGVEVQAIVRAQRTETMRWLQALTRLRGEPQADDVAWQLLLDHYVFAAESEMRWLDHVQARLTRAGAAHPADAAASTLASERERVVARGDR